MNALMGQSSACGSNLCETRQTCSPSAPHLGAVKVVWEGLTDVERTAVGVSRYRKESSERLSKADPHWDGKV